MAHLTRTLPKRLFRPNLSPYILQINQLSTTTRPTTTTAQRTTPRPNTTTTPLQKQRPYHSTLHPRLPDHTYTNSQTAILTAALTHVPTHGFTLESLTLGARSAGFLDVSVQLLPRAEFDLILFWLASRRGLLRSKVEDGALFNRIAAESGHELTVEEKVKALVLERLSLNKEVKGVWQDVSFLLLHSFLSFFTSFFLFFLEEEMRWKCVIANLCFGLQALAQMSLLANIPLSLTELHALASDILTLAGDDAVDAAWYTRRLAVAGIYASAEVVMTRDPTAELVETRAFVERRFEDSRAVKEKIGAVGEVVGFGWNTAVGLGRSWGMKI
jgi:ubiquinone biosynthesis protein COQ9